MPPKGWRKPEPKKKRPRGETIDPDVLWGMYLALGDHRNYQAVAAAAKCHVQTIFKIAKKFKWTEKLKAAGKEFAAKVEAEAIESVHQMNVRHLKALKLLMGRGIECLNRQMAIERPADAIKAIATAVDRERLIRGQPTINQSVQVSGKIELTLEERLRAMAPESRKKLREILDAEKLVMQ